MKRKELVLTIQPRHEVHRTKTEERSLNVARQYAAPPVGPGCTGQDRRESLKLVILLQETTPLTTSVHREKTEESH